MKYEKSADSCWQPNENWFYKYQIILNISTYSNTFLPLQTLQFVQ